MIPTSEIPVSPGARLLASRFGALHLFILLFVVVSFVIRVILSLKALDTLDPSFINLVMIEASGLLFDILAAFYFSIPLILYLIFLPDRILRHPVQRLLFKLVYFCALYVLIFNGVSEWIFWDEFGVRYNFIAVDYLVYTHEVIGNIRQSYPVPKLLSAILVATFAIGWLIQRRGWLDPTFAALTTLRERGRRGSLYLIVPLIAFVAIDQDLSEVSNNRYHNELAKNGIYSLFSAFIHNELPYEVFYLQRDDREMAARVRERLRVSPDTKPLDAIDPLDIARSIVHPGPEKRLNVIQLTIESMSAEYMALFGNQENITPNLDRLAKESLTFTNLYATGNRTDRGMESLVLSVPPTPGRSKVKRPDNEDLFSSGDLFKRRGYDTRFIYGGYGYFDNMNHFFGHNGFEVVDRTLLDASEITHENIWGVADEDLFRRTVREADRAHADGKPFYYFVMTTSNHRPFTYPAGRIDIPSPGGRQGGVKYTDWAIGEFIAQARKRPWFDDTLFIITADHCAGSAGKTELPVHRYHIPLMIHAPRHVPVRMESALMSQIDITPTILGLLNFSYTSRFFGQDIFQTPPEARRAFIGTYQKLGFIMGDRLTVLSPQHQSSFYRFERRVGDERQVLQKEEDVEGLRDAIAFYQTANIMRKKGLDKKIP
ncbi:Phosphoglycerol transferase I [Candidatus Magnetaquicoccaceae bacterium FCR-1]|uniref:Phosphoglycerol transferase I n=1 Tax=Candidatus Magnetaquiglobus chichijimensis TaxID=3141448 RepID=A0ABQ0CCC6_9PROT